MKTYRLFTTSEVRLIQNSLHLTDKELAEKLGRTRSSIINARVRFNIKKKAA